MVSEQAEGRKERSEGSRRLVCLGSERHPSWRREVPGCARHWGHVVEINGLSLLGPKALRAAFMSSPGDFIFSETVQKDENEQLFTNYFASVVIATQGCYFPSEVM